MFKFVLFLSVFVAAAAGTFDHVYFQRKHCRNEEIRTTASYFPYETGLSETWSDGYMCENFTLTKDELDYMAMNGVVLSSKEAVLFKNCKIAYFNANLVSKFPSTYRMHFENCTVSFKNPEVVIKSSVTPKKLSALGFHKCNIFDNLNTSALQTFENFERLLIQNSTLQYSYFDEYFLPKNNDMYRIYIDNVNVKNFHKGLLEKMPHYFSHITCTSCQLEEIDSLFYGMKQAVLDLINFDNNSIKKLPLSLDAFKNFDDLYEMHLSGNEITEPLLKRNHFESLKNLKILDLSRNTDITGISFLTFNDTRLKTLNMSHVNLETLDKLGNSNLKTIDFSHNAISTIQQNVFEDLKYLKFLYLSNNKIEELQGDVFQDLVSLEKLHLNFNKICELPTNLFKRLSSLKLLDISFNSLECLAGLDSLVNLKELYVQHNNLKTIPTLPQTSQKLGSNYLTTIDFSRNVISTIQQNVFEDLINLKFLNLSNNNIGELQGDVFQDLRNLEGLHLKFNKIRAIPRNLFNKLLSLKVLDLSYNFLEYLDGLDSLVKLQELYVQHNSLKAIPSLPSSLMILNVSYNGLDYIRNNTFSNTLQLTSLDISCTKNTYLDLDKESFQKLKSLRILKMAGNSISDIEDIFLPISVLGSMYDISTVTINKMKSLVNLEFSYFPGNNSQCIELSITGKSTKAQQSAINIVVKAENTENKTSNKDVLSEDSVEEDPEYKVFIVNEAVKGGRVIPDLWPLVEDSLLDLILVNPTVDIRFYGTGTDRTGHRFIVCSNVQTLKWIEASIGDLKNLGENVKLKCIVDREKLKKYEIPKTWVWLPKSSYTEEKVLGLLKLQNKQIDTSSWRIVKRGPKRPSGQHFLIEFSNESLKGIEAVHGCLNFSFSRVEVNPTQNLEIEDRMLAADGNSTRCARTVDKWKRVL